MDENDLRLIAIGFFLGSLYGSIFIAVVVSIFKD